MTALAKLASIEDVDSIQDIGKWLDQYKRSASTGPKPSTLTGQMLNTAEQELCGFLDIPLQLQSLIVQAQSSSNSNAPQAYWEKHIKRETTITRLTLETIKRIQSILENNTPSKSALDAFNKFTTLKTAFELFLGTFQFLRKSMKSFHQQSNLQSSCKTLLTNAYKDIFQLLPILSDTVMSMFKSCDALHKHIFSSLLTSVSLLSKFAVVEGDLQLLNYMQVPRLSFNPFRWKVVIRIFKEEMKHMLESNVDAIPLVLHMIQEMVQSHAESRIMDPPKSFKRQLTLSKFALSCLHSFIRCQPMIIMSHLDVTCLCTLIHMSSRLYCSTEGSVAQDTTQDVNMIKAGLIGNLSLCFNPLLLNVTQRTDLFKRLMDMPPIQDSLHYRVTRLFLLNCIVDSMTEKSLECIEMIMKMYGNCINSLGSHLFTWQQFDHYYTTSLLSCSVCLMFVQQDGWDRVNEHVWRIFYESDTELGWVFISDVMALLSHQVSPEILLNWIDTLLCLIWQNCQGIECRIQYLVGKLLKQAASPQLEPISKAENGYLLRLEHHPDLAFASNETILHLMQVWSVLGPNVYFIAGEAGLMKVFEASSSLCMYLVDGMGKTDQVETSLTLFILLRYGLKNMASLFKYQQSNPNVLYNKDSIHEIASKLCVTLTSLVEEGESVLQETLQRPTKVDALEVAETLEVIVTTLESVFIYLTDNQLDHILTSFHQWLHSTHPSHSYPYYSIIDFISNRSWNGKPGHITSKAQDILSLLSSHSDPFIQYYAIQSMTKCISSFPSLHSLVTLNTLPPSSSPSQIIPLARLLKQVPFQLKDNTLTPEEDVIGHVRHIQHWFQDKQHMANKDILKPFHSLIQSVYHQLKTLQ